MANKTYYERGDTFVDTSDKPAIIKRGNELTFTDNFKVGGGADLAPATANTLGGVKVGNGLNVASDGTLSVAGVDYSTTEHLTGRKWKDGKDIYEISFIPSITSLSSGTTETIATGVNYVEKLINSSASITSQDGAGVDGNVSWVDSSGNLKIKPSAGWTNITEIVVTIQYTKVTPVETTNNRTVKKTSKKG